MHPQALASTASERDGLRFSPDGSPMINQSEDEKYMRRALRLAEKARGRTSPNPMVGAVVVKDGRVIARGYHRKAGTPHAEAIALAKAGDRARGATLYVTLEPCSHTNKRTPPCAPLVASSGVRRVVIAMKDPNRQVAGGGEKFLRSKGVEITTGVREAEARRLNEAYIKHVTTGLPFVTLKIAQTLDGRIATPAGESKWITGEEARLEAHRLRDRNDAILVGINTVIKDDPSLTTRIPGGRDPVKIIVDSRLRIPLASKVLTQRSTAGTIVAVAGRATSGKAREVLENGAEVLAVKSERGRVDLKDLMKRLGDRGITSVLIEGGSEISASALAAGLVDKIVVFVAPTLMTGRDAIAAIGGRSPLKLSGAVGLHTVTARFVGRDLMVEGYVARKKPPSRRRTPIRRIQRPS